MEPKKVSDSLTEQMHVVIYPHINGFGRLFGGQLLQWIDEVAGATARRHCGHDATTAAIDNLQFKSGAFLNDVLILIGRVTYVGSTSMEVRVRHLPGKCRWHPPSYQPRLFRYGKYGG